MSASGSLGSAAADEPRVHVNFLPGVYHARDAVAVLLADAPPRRVFVTWRKTGTLYVITYLSATNCDAAPEHVILRRAGAGGVFSLLKSQGGGAPEKYETLGALVASRRCGARYSFAFPVWAASHSTYAYPICRYLDAGHAVRGAVQAVPLPTREELERVEFEDEDSGGAHAHGARPRAPARRA